MVGECILLPNPKEFEWHMVAISKVLLNGQYRFNDPPYFPWDLPVRQTLTGMLREPSLENRLAFFTAANRLFGLLRQISTEALGAIKPSMFFASAYSLRFLERDPVAETSESASSGCFELVFEPKRVTGLLNDLFQSMLASYIELPSMPLGIMAVDLPMDRDSRNLNLALLGAVRKLLAAIEKAGDNKPLVNLTLHSAIGIVNQIPTIKRGSSPVRLGKY